ncbi:MAG: hypothetical protein E2O95_01225 [Acidobacteria bacterium]|nr:MAG: hypothetical protein E2O95_01225 [Acidobacteriota bacterium]
MTLGPIEMLVLGFPGSKFSGGILPELERLVGAGTIIDAMVMIKSEDGDLDILEIAQIPDSYEMAALAALIDNVNGMLSEDDLIVFADELSPGESAAVLVFEHTWFKPLRDEILDSGGVVLADTRVPGFVVEEILLELAESE